MFILNMAKVSNKEFNIFTSNHRKPKAQSALVLFYSYNSMMTLTAYIPTVVISGQKPHPHQKICILKGPCSAYLSASLQKLNMIYPLMLTLPCKSSGTCAAVGPVKWQMSKTVIKVMSFIEFIERILNNLNDGQIVKKINKKMPFCKIS